MKDNLLKLTDSLQKSFTDHSLEIAIPNCRIRLSEPKSKLSETNGSSLIPFLSLRLKIQIVLLLCLQSSGRIEGCGACYHVRCKIPQLCDDNGAYVVVTDYGEGDRTDFIMSPRALLLNGYLGFENVYCLL
ncbi:hypothetical protein P8452_00414 [Trifolium repens]|nr:hypothetical protein P8452_00414 [Trifolium repens]